MSANFEMFKQWGPRWPLSLLHSSPPFRNPWDAHTHRAPSSNRCSQYAQAGHHNYHDTVLTDSDLNDLLRILSALFIGFLAQLFFFFASFLFFNHHFDLYLNFTYVILEHLLANACDNRVNWYLSDIWVNISVSLHFYLIHKFHFLLLWKHSNKNKISVINIIIQQGIG